MMRQHAGPAFGDAPMNAGFGRIGLRSFVGSGETPPRSDPRAGVWFKRGLLWLLAAVIVGSAVWLLMPPSEGNVAQTEPVKLALATVDAVPAVTGSAPSEADAAGLDRLKISSQT